MGILRSIKLICVFLIFSTGFAFSQSNGKLLINNYGQLDIGSESGIFWSVIKDNRGVLYFGGEGKVFEFDGINWRGIEVSNLSVVRSLAIDEKGVIYVGAVGEFGYLEPDNKGQLRYKSLLGSIPKNSQSFPDVWSIGVTKEGIYFQADNRLFRYKNQKIDVWNLQNSYHRAFVINDKIYFNQRDIGLCTIENDKIKLTNNGGFFKNMVISSFLTYGNDKVLVGTRKDGMYLYDINNNYSNISEFKSEANDFIKENQLYHAVNLPEGRIAIATLRTGVIICDRDGKILKYINKSTGFNDYTAYYLNLFNENELWITSTKGIGYYLINSPLSYWNDEQGLMGVINGVIENNNRVYVATNNGIYYMDLGIIRKKANYVPTDFQTINNLKTEVWGIQEYDLTGRYDNPSEIQLIASTGKGLYNIKEKSIVFSNEGNGQITMRQSRKNPSLLYFNTHPTFYVLQYNSGKWNVVWKKNISSYVLSIVEDTDGNVWIGTKFYGIFKIELIKFFNTYGTDYTKKIPPVVSDNIKIVHYTTVSGLPNLNLCLTHMYKDNLVISCNGLFSYDQGADRFVVSTIFGDEIKKWNKTVNAFEEDIYGNIWGLESGVLDKLPDGTFKLTCLPYQLLSGKNSSLSFFHNKDGITWIGGEQGLFRYDSKSVKPSNNYNFETIIRKVTINSDSIIYDGAGILNANENSGSYREISKSVIPKLSHKIKAISIDYACPYFQDDIPLEYSYYLEGYDNTWGEWSHTVSKEYNNLRENKYKFHVRAKKYTGAISSEDVFEFIITPPWYRTIIAYFLYFVIFCFVIYYSIKLYSIRLRRHNLILERQVKERTLRLEEQKEEINKQADILKQQNEKLIHQKNRMAEMSKEILETNKSKLQFFTNISHELRTPLSLILGPTEELINSDKNLSDNTRRNFYTVIHRNASRLLTLVNQLLDFRKLEITSQKIRASEGDLIGSIEEIVTYFKDFAFQKNIDFTLHSDLTSIQTWFDRDVIEKILFNLISNAFKYTYENGKIKVEISITDHHPLTDIKGKVIRISVIDNGMGISSEVLPKIFDRYYHSSRAVSLSQAGSGIGLSMAAKLAENHHGKIVVTSELKKGSNFTLFIPFGNEFLSEEEIIKTADAEHNSAYIESNLSEFKYSKTLNKTTSSNEPDENKYTVLIVDDSDDIRLYIIASLSDTFNFIEAKDGSEGIIMSKKHGPDIIICDIMMPNMDGYEFCQKIKSDVETSHIPVIMLTSKSGTSDMKMGLDLGADDFIRKPFNISVLESRINNLIKSRNELRDRYSKEIVVKPTDIVITSTDEKFLNKAIKIVEDHISDPSYDIDTFSRDMAMSQSTLYRKLKSLTGESTNNFIKNLRLNRAASLLAQNEISVSEIANMVGFDDPAYFSKSFKQKFGLSPSDFSRKHL